MIPTYDFAIGADNGGTQVVGDESGLGLVDESEEVSEFGQFVGTRYGELPAAKKFGIVRMGYREGVVAKNLRSIVFGIEADAEKLNVGESGVGAELLIDLGEIAAHPRTEVWEGAARIDESNEQNLSAILLQENALAFLIGESEIGDLVAGSGKVLRDRRRTFSMGGDFNVFEPVVGSGILVPRCRLDDHYFRRDGVARCELSERGRGLEFVGHGHRVHESGDRVGVDDGRLIGHIDRDDAAGEGIALRRWKVRTIAG